MDGGFYGDPTSGCSQKSVAAQPSLKDRQGWPAAVPHRGSALAEIPQCVVEIDTERSEVSDKERHAVLITVAGKSGNVGNESCLRSGLPCSRSALPLACNLSQDKLLGQTEDNMETHA